MSDISSVDWGESFLESGSDPQILKDYRRAGPTPPGIEFMMDCPWLARSLLTVNLYGRLLVHTDLDFSELLWLAVSQDNSCRYCYAAHQTVLRILGHSRAQIRTLEEELFTAELNTRDRLALDFARRVSRGSPPPDRSDKQRLIDVGFEPEAVDELTFVVAFIVFTNRFATLPALPLQPVEEFADRWYIRLFRPLLSQVLRAFRKPGQPEALAAEMRGGPFSYLVEALDGLPIAGALRRLLDDAFASEVLPARTRGLIFAVIARAIGCPLSEAEARSLLAAEGMTAESVDAVLRHLGSPELDAAEALIVPFARETVRMQVPDVQRKARKLSDELGTKMFLEVLGICSLANMLCRMGLVAETGPIDE
jgi:AhpD family alkylhydroperoxidase